MSLFQPTPDFREILGRAVADADYRARLFDDPEAALQGYRPSADDLSALSRLGRVALEAHAEAVHASGAPGHIVGDPAPPTPPPTPPTPPQPPTPPMPPSPDDPKN